MAAAANILPTPGVPEVTYVEISGQDNHCFYLAFGAAFNVTPAQVAAAIHHDVLSRATLPAARAYFASADVQRLQWGATDDLQSFCNQLGPSAAVHLLALPSAVNDRVASHEVYRAQPASDAVQPNYHICVMVCGANGDPTASNHYGLLQFRFGDCPLRCYLRAEEWPLAMQQALAPNSGADDEADDVLHAMRVCMQEANGRRWSQPCRTSTGDHAVLAAPGHTICQRTTEAFQQLRSLCLLSCPTFCCRAAPRAPGPRCTFDKLHAIVR
jgi:hypothetical protein